MYTLIVIHDFIAQHLLICGDLSVRNRPFGCYSLLRLECQGRIPDEDSVLMAIRVVEV